MRANLISQIYLHLPLPPLSQFIIKPTDDYVVGKVVKGIVYDMDNNTTLWYFGYQLPVAGFPL